MPDENTAIKYADALGTRLEAVKRKPRNLCGRGLVNESCMEADYAFVDLKIDSALYETCHALVKGAQSDLRLWGKTGQYFRPAFHVSFDTSRRVQPTLGLPLQEIEPPSDYPDAALEADYPEAEEAASSSTRPLPPWPLQEIKPPSGYPDADLEADYPEAEEAPASPSTLPLPPRSNEADACRPSGPAEEQVPMPKRMPSRPSGPVEALLPMPTRPPPRPPSAAAAASAAAEEQQQEKPTLAAAKARPSPPCPTGCIFFPSTCVPLG